MTASNGNGSTEKRFFGRREIMEKLNSVSDRFSEYLFEVRSFWVVRGFIWIDDRQTGSILPDHHAFPSPWLWIATTLQKWLRSHSGGPTLSCSTRVWWHWVIALLANDMPVSSLEKVSIRERDNYRRFISLSLIKLHVCAVFLILHL